MEEQYLLRWHCHESTLSKNLPALLESNILCDCTIAAGSKTYKAHRVVLAACSPYFLEIFQNIGLLESSVIVLHDVSAEDIEAILSYIYRGQCLVTKSQIPRLIHLAKTLKIQGLCNMKIQHDDEIEDTNEECELETAREESAAKTSSKRDNREIKGREISPAVIADDMVAKKTTLKDAPEICKCFICGKYLSNQYNLRVHMETHKDAYYSCLSCPHVSKSRDALRKHVSYRHPEEYTSRKRKKNS